MTPKTGFKSPQYLEWRQRRHGEYLLIVAQLLNGQHLEPKELEKAKELVEMLASEVRARV